jgi:hypothetical protein
MMHFGFTSPPTAGFPCNRWNTPLPCCHHEKPLVSLHQRHKWAPWGKPIMPPVEQPPDPWRAFLSVLEEEKRKGRIDDIITQDVTLLLDEATAQVGSDDTIRANVRSVLNSKIAKRFGTGRA